MSYSGVNALHTIGLTDVLEMLTITVDVGSCTKRDSVDTAKSTTDQRMKRRGHGAERSQVGGIPLTGAVIQTHAA